MFLTLRKDKALWLLQVAGRPERQHRDLLPGGDSPDVYEIFTSSCRVLGSGCQKFGFCPKCHHRKDNHLYVFHTIMNALTSISWIQRYFYFLQVWTQFWERSRGRLGTRCWSQRTPTTRWEIPAAGLFKCSQVRMMSLRSCKVIPQYIKLYILNFNSHTLTSWNNKIISLPSYYATVLFLK